VDEESVREILQDVHHFWHTPCSDTGKINWLQDTLHQNGITLAAKNCHGKHQNRQGNDPWRLAAKQNPPSIESQGNQIFLAASRQGLFFWRFGRQVK